MIEDLEDRHKKSKMCWVIIAFSLLAIVLNYLHRLSFNYLAADWHLRDIISVEAYEYNTTAFFVAFMLSSAVSGLVIDKLGTQLFSKYGCLDYSRHSACRGYVSCSVGVFSFSFGYRRSRNLAC